MQNSVIVEKIQTNILVCAMLEWLDLNLSLFYIMKAIVTESESHPS